MYVTWKLFVINEVLSEQDGMKDVQKGVQRDVQRGVQKDV